MATLAVFRCRHGGSVCAKVLPDKDFAVPGRPVGTATGPDGGSGTKSASLEMNQAGLLVRSPPFQGSQAEFESRTV